MGNNSVPKFIFRLSRFPVYRGSVLGMFYCTSLVQLFPLQGMLLTPVIEYRRGRDFLHKSISALGPTQPLVNGYRVALTTQPLLAPRLKKRIQLYLYYPSGPSWPVLGWTYLHHDFPRWSVFPGNPDHPFHHTIRMTEGSGVPRNFFRGGSTNSVEDRENGDLEAVAP